MYQYIHLYGTQVELDISLPVRFIFSYTENKLQSYHNSAQHLHTCTDSRTFKKPKKILHTFNTVLISDRDQLREMTLKQ